MAKWAAQAGGTGNSFGVAVEQCADGSVVVVGGFDGETVIGRGEPNETALVAATGQDPFFARYAPDGSLAWARGAHGTKDAEPMAMACLPDGSFVVAGWFWGDLTFDGGQPTETTLSNGDMLDAFLCRVGADGTVQWARQLCGALGGTGHDLALLADGGIVVGGICGGAVTFGEGEPTETTLPFGDGWFEGFAACYEPDGSFRWVRGTRSAANSYAATWGVAACPDGSVGICGQFLGTLSLGTAGVDEVTLTSTAGSGDHFLARYDASGALAWALSGGCEGTDTVDDMTAGPDGTLYLSGTFEGVATFHCLAGLPQALAPRGAADGFVAAYRPGGELRWVAQAGGAETDRAAALAARPEGGVVGIGCFGGDAYFGDGGETVVHDHGAGDCEAFVASWDADGTLAWARGIGGSADDHGFGIALAPDGAVLVTGSFVDWLCLDGSAGDGVDLTAQGPCDAFVARLQPAGDL